MLYDTRWDKKLETKPADPFLARLIAWLEMQPDEIYSTSPLTCIFSQFLRAQGFTGSLREACKILDSTPLRYVALTQPHTFGAALDRARCLAAK
jgi:hypothetical protein